MRRFTIICALSVSASWGCGSDDDGKDAGAPDAGPARYGLPCTTDQDCASKMCLEYEDAKGNKKKVCTKLCKRLSDCGSVLGQGFDCGAVAPKKVVCYPRTYKTGKFIQGHDCSSDGKCAVGYLCTGQAGDADRYCASPCEEDMDCPPRYRCATTRTGKTLDKVKRCLLRRFCHPCAIDDQCGGPTDLCVKDKNGNGYCSQDCSKSAASTCPEYTKCGDAGNNKLQCKHKAGYCFKSFNKDGGLCDPCIYHGWKKVGVSVCTRATTIAEEGICKEGAYCQLLDKHKGDAACITACDSSDSCPTGYHCWDTVPCGSTTGPKDMWYKPIFGKRMCAPIDSDNNLTGCFTTYE